MLDNIKKFDDNDGVNEEIIDDLRRNAKVGDIIEWVGYTLKDKRDFGVITEKNRDVIFVYWFEDKRKIKHTIDEVSLELL